MNIGKWTLERWIAVLALAFTAGMNWGPVADFKIFKDKTVPETYVRKDLYDVNQQHLSNAINDLNKSLRELLALERQTGEPARIQREASRMFDK